MLLSFSANASVTFKCTCSKSLVGVEDGQVWKTKGVKV